MTERKNDDLKNIYNKAYENNKSYAADEGSFFTFSTQDITNFLIGAVDFKNANVLEVGCGTGETALEIAKAGAAQVLAIDYAEEAIKGCRTNHQHPALRYEVEDFNTIDETFDIVVLQEVIEHLDNTEDTIEKLMRLVDKNGGALILTCPNFTNTRGYVWMTLQLLLDVPMSLTDIHFFSPFDFIEFAEKAGLDLEWTTFAHDRVYNPENLRYDYKKRLTNALRDANLDNSRVDDLLVWLEKAVAFDNKPTEVNGGKGFYKFSWQKS